ncbi:MAG: hypothetical protein ACFFDN_48790 [Candidatus Hodarchaeota archaeon]
MTAVEEEIIPKLKELPKYKIFEEVKEKIEKEIETIVIEKETVDPIDKERELKRWKQTMGFYLLNPHKFRFGLKDLHRKLYIK